MPFSVPKEARNTHLLEVVIEKEDFKGTNRVMISVRLRRVSG